MPASSALLIFLGCAALGAWGTFGLVSLREGERRAGRIAAVMAGACSVPLFLVLLLPTPVEWIVLGLLAAAAAIAGVVLLIPVGRVDRGNDVPRVRVDERDIMFARARLQPGGAHYETYYRLRPANQASDDRTRSLPGLLSPEASGYHPLVFAATEGSFALTESVRDAVDGPVAEERTRVEPGDMTVFIKDLARHYGAFSVGVAELRPYHVYTHVGRGSGEYGAPVELEHGYAVAFTVEMEWELLSAAPRAPAIMESARQYVEAAKVALQLASFCRRLGYPARAHIDGNYRVIAPLVALDAGLGEIGRMGLLVTPRLGPRVRLGVVTTDLPLLPDGRTDDDSVLDFCRICKKCADCCPIHAISQGDREEIGGVLRWRINPDLCFRYWSAMGTDCGRCMAVCPYSRPDNLAHNAVRWVVRRSGSGRRAAAWLDNLLYGAVPEPKAYPAWIPPGPAGRWPVADREAWPPADNVPEADATGR